MSIKNCSEVLSNSPVTISNTSSATLCPVNAAPSSVAASGFAQTTFSGGPLEANGSLNKKKVSVHLDYRVFNQSL